MIQNEIKENEKINQKNKTNETPEEIKKKISNICFSIVLSYIILCLNLILVKKT